jgi:fatty acid desaturase
MHVLGIKRLLRQRDHASAVEISLIMLHAALYLTVVLWVLSPLRALAFIAVQQAVFSLYLGISFAPNHKAMPIIESATAAGFARRQVVTARNIRGGRFTTFLLGGLNYQIEHHLFPSMPRPNLRRVQGLVRDFCVAADLGYREESFTGSFRQIAHHLSSATPEQPPAVLTDYLDLTGKTGTLYQAGELVRDPRHASALNQPPATQPSGQGSRMN